MADGPRYPTLGYPNRSGLVPTMTCFLGPIATPFVVAIPGMWKYVKDIRNTAMIIMCSYCDDNLQSYQKTLPWWRWYLGYWAILVLLFRFVSVCLDQNPMFCRVPYLIGTCKGEKMVIALKNSIFHYTQQIPSVWRESRSARQNGHKKNDLHLKEYLPNYLLFWYHNYSPTDFPTINTWAYQVLDIKKSKKLETWKNGRNKHRLSRILVAHFVWYILFRGFDTSQLYPIYISATYN